MMEQIIKSMLFWFFAGIMLLNATVYLVYKTGIVYKSRNKNGLMKKDMPITGSVVTAVFMIMILAFFVLFDYLSLHSFKMGFLQVAAANLVLTLLLSLYDALFIDIFVLAIWKPGFLDIPKEVTMESMKTHVKKQFTLGWVFKIPIVLISAFIYWAINA